MTKEEEEEEEEKKREKREITNSLCESLKIDRE